MMEGLSQVFETYKGSSKQQKQLQGLQKAGQAASSASEGIQEAASKQVNVGKVQEKKYGSTVSSGSNNAASIFKPKKLQTFKSTVAGMEHCQTNPAEDNRRMSLQHILCADAFMNNSIEVQGVSRINTILNETFQLTVRQQIYEEDEEEEEKDAPENSMKRIRNKFHNHQTEAENSSTSPQPFNKAAAYRNGTSTGESPPGGVMGKPLQIKKLRPSNPFDKKQRTMGLNNMLDEQLSDVDEEEEKRIAIAFTEVKQGSVYRDRQMTMAKGKAPNMSVLRGLTQIGSADDNQSIMADMANDCETNRINNDNYRLDMTWADQEVRQESIVQVLQRSSPFVQVFYTVFLAQENSSQLGLLTYQDAMTLKSTCRVIHQTFELAKGLKKVIRYGNLNSELRPRYWRHITDQDNIREQVREMAEIPADESIDVSSLYRAIMERVPDDESRLTEKIRDEISKDLARTRTSERVRTVEGQEEMRRVLLAIAYCMPDVGYCQGMNFIASVLISIAESEEQGFIIFMFLLISKEMKPLFLPGVPELHLKNFQIAQLIKFHMPNFFQHLRQIQMTPDYFTSKWFMTVFACFLPYSLMTPIFDMFLLEGWRAVFRIGVALLRILEPELIRMDMVDMCQYFRDTVRFEKVANEYELFSAAAGVRVNKILIHNKELEKLREKFYILQAQVKLENDDTWQPDQEHALKQAREQFEKLDPHTREDILKFQEKLGKIDKQLDLFSKVHMNATLEYYAVRDEYVALMDKVKALEQTYNCLSEQFKSRVSSKQWTKQQQQKADGTASKNAAGIDTGFAQSGMLPGSFPAASTANLYNQNNQYKLDLCDEKHQRQHEEAELQRQIMDDLREIFEKKDQASNQAELLKPDYKAKKTEYELTKDKVEDLLQHKEKVKEQMLGFLKMYEVKKEATLMQLSHALQKSDSFKKQHVF